MKGLGTALITPFNEDKSVDYEALSRLLDLQMSGNVDYIVVLGTTAEAATLSANEKKQVREFIVKKIGGKLPLVLGLGGNNTMAIIDEISNMGDDLKQFSAILSVCPYYNKPSQEGLYQHFCAIAKVCPIPIILYNVPGRTGVNLLPETVMRIYKAYPQKIMGIKEASGNVEQIKKLIFLRNEENLRVISGDDGIACELMEAGADGLISVASNAFAEDFRKIIHQKNRQVQEKYANMVHLLFKEGNPSGIKSVLSQQGIVKNSLRLPLVANSESVQNEIRQELQKLAN